MCRIWLKLAGGIVIGLAGFALALVACLDYVSAYWSMVGVLVVLFGLLMAANAWADKDDEGREGT